MILEEIIRKQKLEIERLERDNIRLNSNCKTLAELLDKEKENNKKAVEFLDTQYNTYSSAEEWRKALKEILKDSDKE